MGKERRLAVKIETSSRNIRKALRHFPKACCRQGLPLMECPAELKIVKLGCLSPVFQDGPYATQATPLCGAYEAKRDSELVGEVMPTP